MHSMQIFASSLCLKTKALKLRGNLHSTCSNSKPATNVVTFSQYNTVVSHSTAECFLKEDSGAGMYVYTYMYMYID